MRFKVIVLALVALFATSAAVSAQVAGGNITGTVKDQQAGVLPGVAVTLEGAGPTLLSTTDGNGEYRFLNLPPGTYKVTAVLTGFATVIREGVALQVGQTVELPFAMKVATVQESITVSGEVPSEVFESLVLKEKKLAFRATKLSIKWRSTGVPRSQPKSPPIGDNRPKSPKRTDLNGI